jgi:hypothetical protein
MGNGGRSGGSEITLRRHRGDIAVGLFAALLALLLAASALLGGSYRKSIRQAMAQAPVVRPVSSVASFLRPARLALEPDGRGPLPLKPNAQHILGQLPLMFEPNQGQADSSIRFLARGAGYGLYLDPAGATLSFATASPRNGQAGSRREAHLRMNLAGSNPVAVATGSELLPGKTNYLIGNDPKKWHTDIPQFAQVRYASVYPGIDLVFYGNQGRLEYDFRVAPGADPRQAMLQFEGAGKVEVRGGDLVFVGGNASGLRLQVPQIYQRDGDRKQPVAGHFTLRGGNRVGFAVGEYDRSRELIIDPILDFSTYFGGAGTETSPSVAVNGDGFIYVAGSTTNSTGFPVAGTTIGSAGNVFVTKINPTQPASVIYLTFLGGNGTDTSVGIGVDSGGLTYIAGTTTSTNFPTTSNGYQNGTTATALKGAPCTGITCSSVFVSVLNAVGDAQTYATYLSGNGNDVASGMTIDLTGNAYVTGSTTSNNATSLDVVFPASSFPFQALPLSAIQFFVTKINTNLPGTSSVAYSTYFGAGTPAGAVAVGGGIAVDNIGNMYFTGTTNFYNSGQGPYGDSSPVGTDFPILNSYQPCLDTVPPTVLGTSNPCSPPTTLASGAYPTDAFLAKINPNAAQGAQLLFSTYLGGTVNETGTGVAIDSGAANIYLTGETNSDSPPFNFPTGVAPYQPCLDTPSGTLPSCTGAPTSLPSSPANYDAYVARFTNPTVSTTGTPNDVALTYFTYLGGGGNDSGSAIAVLDTSSTSLDDVVVTGATNSGTNSFVANPPPFPVTLTCALPPCVLQSTLNGVQNAFYAEINTTTTTGQTGGSYVTYFGGTGVDSGTGIAVDPYQNTYFVGQTTSTSTSTPSFPLANPLQANLSGTQDAFIVKWGTATSLCLNCVAPVVSPIGVVSAGNAVTITYTLINQGPDPATNVTVTGLVSQPATFDSASVGSGTCATPSGSSVVCEVPALQSGGLANITFSVTPMAGQANYQTTATATSNNNTSTNNTAPASFNAGGYTMQISPSSQTVTAGLPASYSVVVSPLPIYGATVGLSCGGSVPVGATCNFTSKSLVLNGPQAAVLNITTTAQPVPVAGSRFGTRSVYGLWLMVPGLAIWGAGSRRRRLLAWLAAFVVLALVFLQPSCSHVTPQPTVSGTPSGTYPLTVNATSGTFTQSVPFTLTVTP